MSRTSRQSKILNIIATYDVETQEELATMLKLAGFEVTQATISRDIKELGLIKTQGANGKYKYATKQTMDLAISGKLLNVVREATLSVVTCGNLIVVKTISDGATAVSSALEQYLGSEVVGIVADRNTILIVNNSLRDAEYVSAKINQLL